MYYVLKGDDQLGPFEEIELREMITSAHFTGEELAWREGMPDWVPINNIFPPPPPPNKNPPTTEIRIKATRIEWLPALAMNAVALAMEILVLARVFVYNFALAASRPSYGGYSEPKQDGNDLDYYLFLLWGAVWIIAILFSLILHFRCWSFLPKRFCSVSPGKAVGFLFIPFYNFYWAFVTWPKLARGYEELQEALGVNNPTRMFGLALTYAILFVTGWVACAITTLSIVPFSIANFVIFVLLYSRITNVANRIAETAR